MYTFRYIWNKTLNWITSEGRANPQNIESSLMATNTFREDTGPESGEKPYDPYCELCVETKGQNISAFSYCRECNQFLCHVCNVFHSKLQGTKGHKVDTGDDMPGSMDEKNTKFDVCPHHARERKDQFCFEHKLLICLSYARYEHWQCLCMPVFKACKNVSTAQLDYLCDRLSALETNLQSVLPELSANKEHLEGQKKKSMEKAKSIYEKSIAKAEMIYQEMQKQITEKYWCNKSTICQQQESIKILSENVHKSLKWLEKLKGSRMTSKIFLKIQDIVSYTNGYMHFVHDMNCALTGPVEITIWPTQRVERYMFAPTHSVNYVLERKSKSNVTITEPQISFPIITQRDVTLN